MRWHLRNSNMRKRSTIMQQWKRIRLIHAETTGGKMMESTGDEIFRARTQILDC